MRKYMRKVLVLAAALLLSAQMMPTQVYAAADGSFSRNYQEILSGNASNAEEMKALVQRGIDAHASKIYIASSVNFFQEMSAYLNAILTETISTYNNTGCNGYHLSKTGKDYVVTLYYLDTIEEDSAAIAYIQQTYMQLAGADTVATIKNVHDYVCNLITYSDATAAEQADFRSAYDALASRQAVCTGYATLFQKYMEAFGIPGYIVKGTLNGQGHVWNVVHVNGQWYVVDCTWDDMGANGISYNRFLAGADRTGYANIGGLALAPVSCPY